MDLIVSEDMNGGTAILTTDSPASHYGMPVLQITSEDIDGDFGPGDLINLGEMPMSASNDTAADSTSRRNWTMPKSIKASHSGEQR